MKSRGIGWKILRIKILVAIFGAMFSITTYAEQIATTSDGKKVTLHNNGTYSFVAETNATSYRKLDYADFMIDGALLDGQKITITGPLGTFNSSRKKFPVGQLYQKYTASGPYIRVETKNISREDLKYIHCNCHTDCYVSISGTAKKDSYGDGAHIMADSVKPKKRY